MRTREEILKSRKHLDWESVQGRMNTDPNWVGQEDSELILEVLLDCRDLLQKKTSRRIIETEVPLNEKEQQILNSLDENNE